MQMKKIFFLIIVAFALNSCNKEEDSSQVRYELLPIDYCRMPYYFQQGETYDLEMFFKKPTSCHFYKGIYFEKQGNTRVVAIQSAVVQTNSCVTYDYQNNTSLQPDSVKCKFTATGTETYTFKFWTGKNAQGEDTYYDVEVPVEN